MERGNLAVTSEDTFLVAMDAENIFYTTGSIIRKHELTEKSRLAMEVLKKLSDSGSDIYLIAVKNGSAYEKLFFKMFDIPCKFLTFASEDSLREWLKIRQPQIHLACVERKHYFRTSYYADDVALRNFLTDF